MVSMSIEREFFFTYAAVENWNYNFSALKDLTVSILKNAYSIVINQHNEIEKRPRIIMKRIMMKWPRISVISPHITLNRPYIHVKVPNMILYKSLKAATAFHKIILKRGHRNAIFLLFYHAFKQIYFNHMRLTQQKYTNNDQMNAPIINLNFQTEVCIIKSCWSCEPQLFTFDAYFFFRLSTFLTS